MLFTNKPKARQKQLPEIQHPGICSEDPFSSGVFSGAAGFDACFSMSTNKNRSQGIGRRIFNPLIASKETRPAYIPSADSSTQIQMMKQLIEMQSRHILQLEARLQQANSKLVYLYKNTSKIEQQQEQFSFADEEYSSVCQSESIRLHLQALSQSLMTIVDKMANEFEKKVTDRLDFLNSIATNVLSRIKTRPATLTSMTQDMFEPFSSIMKDPELSSHHQIEQSLSVSRDGSEQSHSHNHTKRKSRKFQLKPKRDKQSSHADEKQFGEVQTAMGARKDNISNISSLHSLQITNQDNYFFRSIQEGEDKQNKVHEVAGAPMKLSIYLPSEAGSSRTIRQRIPLTSCPLQVPSPELNCLNIQVSKRALLKQSINNMQDYVQICQQPFASDKPAPKYALKTSHPQAIDMHKKLLSSLLQEQQQVLQILKEKHDSSWDNSSTGNNSIL